MEKIDLGTGQFDIDKNLGERNEQMDESRS
jgi:hypothetical protein